MNILLIEDEFLLATDLKMTLQEEGYEVLEVFDNGIEALEFYKNNEIDLLICDINIDGDWDGIETAKRLLDVKPAPLIYLTALSDAETIERAKKTFPAAYISKPFQISVLRMAVELAIHNFVNKTNHVVEVEESKEDRENLFRETFLVVDEFIFIKQNYQFVKFNLNEIYYFEAEHIHTNVYTKTKKYAVRMSLGGVLEKLPVKNFVRVHRSFAVNIHQIDSFNEHEIIIASQQIPLSRGYKNDFVRFFT
ncbi:MAG: response regulator [Spirosomaceae bacterium]|jgi:DNA-binding LytR/AlgR family response regulator|nr:response regulator [Spirosomataceae bacterium]